MVAKNEISILIRAFEIVEVWDGKLIEHDLPDYGETEGDPKLVFGDDFDRHILMLILSNSIPSLLIGFVLGAWIF